MRSIGSSIGRNRCRLPLVSSKWTLSQHHGATATTTKRFVGMSKRDEDAETKEKRHRWKALYTQSMPRIPVETARIPFHHPSSSTSSILSSSSPLSLETTSARRWHSTPTVNDFSSTTSKFSSSDKSATPSSSTSKDPSTSSSSSPTFHNSDDKNIENNKNNNSTNIKPSMSDKLRSSLRDGKHNMDELRDTAASQLREFREHPRESAKHGARTVSAVFKKYGPVFVGTYASVYFSTLGLLFIGVQSGVLDPIVLFSWFGPEGASSQESTASTVHLVVDFMDNHSFTKPYSHIIERHPAFANLAVAWIAVKFTEPIRLAVALTITPRVSRFLGYTKEEQEPPQQQHPPDSSDAIATTTSTTTTNDKDNSMDKDNQSNPTHPPKA